MTAEPGLALRIGRLIREQLSIDVPAPDTDLLEEGLVDSLGLVTLIVALEAEFDFELLLDDFDVDAFRSVQSIAALLASMSVADRPSW